MARPLSAKHSVKMGFKFDTDLGNSLEGFKEAVMYQDFDCVVLVDGKEGTGKSVHGMQIAKFLDVDNDIDIEKQICYTPEQLKKAITTLPKFKAIVFDEARRGFNRRRSTQDVNIDLTDLFAECRQNNLFLIIIMPSFYDMDQQIAVWRSRLLIHVWYEWDLKAPKGEKLVRGFAHMYNENAKYMMYYDKNLKYKYPPNYDEGFDYRFNNHYVVDEQKYRDYKRKSQEAYSKKSIIKPINDVAGAITYLKEKNFLKEGAIPSLCLGFLEISERAFQMARKKRTNEESHVTV